MKKFKEKSIEISEIPDFDKLSHELISIIIEIINEKNWTQTEAGKFLKLGQAKVSRLKNGFTAGFSIKKILTTLIRSNCKIVINVKNKDGSI